MALLLTALLGACASPITARVTRFNQWPADLTGSTFSFRTPVDTGHELEQATYEGHVQAALEKQGLKRAPAGQLGRIQAEVSATLRSKEKHTCNRFTRTTRFFCRLSATPLAAFFRAPGQPIRLGHAMWVTAR